MHACTYVLQVTHGVAPDLGPVGKWNRLQRTHHSCPLQRCSPVVCHSQLPVINDRGITQKKAKWNRMDIEWQSSCTQVRKNDLLSNLGLLSTTEFCTEHFPDSSPELKPYFKRRYLISDMSAGPPPKKHASSITEQKLAIKSMLWPLAQHGSKLQCLNSNQHHKNSWTANI